MAQSYFGFRGKYPTLDEVELERDNGEKLLFWMRNLKEPQTDEERAIASRIRTYWSSTPNLTKVDK